MIQVQHVNHTAGDLFMDTPRHQDINDLIQQVNDKSYWKSLTNNGILYIFFYLCYEKWELRTEKQNTISLLT